MMLSQPFRAYQTEPKEAAPCLLIIPSSSAALNAPELSGWISSSGERLSAGRLWPLLDDHAISLFSMAAFRLPPLNMKST
jgi:hypothetical protein